MNRIIAARLQGGVCPYGQVFSGDGAYCCRISYGEGEAASGDSILQGEVVDYRQVAAQGERVRLPVSAAQQQVIVGGRRCVERSVEVVVLDGGAGGRGEIVGCHCRVIASPAYPQPPAVTGILPELVDAGQRVGAQVQSAIIDDNGKVRQVCYITGEVDGNVVHDVQDVARLRNYRNIGFGVINVLSLVHQRPGICAVPRRINSEPVGVEVPLRVQVLRAGHQQDRHRSQYPPAYGLHANNRPPWHPSHG